MNSLMFQSSHSMDIFNISAGIIVICGLVAIFTKKDSLLQLVIGNMNLTMMFTKEDKMERVFKMLEEGKHKNREIMETTKMPRTRRKLLLELNVEPSITNQQEEAFVEINEVNDVLLRDPGKVSVDNECLFQKKTNGPNSLSLNACIK